MEKSNGIHKVSTEYIGVDSEKVCIFIDDEDNVIDGELKDSKDAHLLGTDADNVSISSRRSEHPVDYHIKDGDEKHVHKNIPETRLQ